jgi:HEAT repeat protein
MVGWIGSMIGDIRDWFAVRRLRALAERDPVAAVIATHKRFNFWQESIVTALVNRSDPLLVPALILVLGDESEDLQVRQDAAFHLGVTKDPRAMDALLAAVGDRDAHLRASAVRALATMPDSRVMAALVAALADEQSLVRECATSGLGKTSDPGAIDPLLAALEDSEWGVRSSAIDALAGMSDPRVVPALIATLEDEEPWVRRGAAYHLGELKASEAVDALLGQVPNVEISDAVIGALGKIEGAEAARHLLPLLRSRHWQCRGEAARVLGKVGCTQAVPALVALLSDSHESVVYAAAEALEALGDKQGLEALAEWRRSTEAERSDLRAAIIIFTREFSPKDTFISSILGRMEVRGKSYRTWMTERTPLRVVVNPDALDPPAFLAVATIEFRRMLEEAVDLEKVEYATFEGSHGISGVILTLWES